MLNIIALHKKILYTIINTLNKITTTSSIYFAKTNYFGIKSFWKIEKKVLQTKTEDKYKRQIRQ